MQLIVEVEKKRHAALERRDYDALAELLDPNLTYVHSSGTVDTIDAYLHKLRTGHYVYSTISHTVDRVEVRGDLALAFGSVSCAVSVQGNLKSLNNLYLAAWVRDADSWKLLAYQPTPAKTN